MASPWPVTPEHTQEQGSEAVHATFKDYSRIANALRFSTSDGTIFKVEESALGLVSPIFRNMFEDATDTGEILVLQDPTKAWTIILDTMYNPEASDLLLPASKFDDVDSTLDVCERYEMTVIKDHLTNRLVFVFSPFYDVHCCGGITS